MNVLIKIKKIPECRNSILWEEYLPNTVSVTTGLVCLFCLVLTFLLIHLTNHKVKLVTLV